MSHLINLSKYDTLREERTLCEGAQSKTTPLELASRTSSCESAIAECKICLKANEYRGEKNARAVCYKICDKSDYCKMRKHNYGKTCDPPYWNRHPLEPDPSLPLYKSVTVINSTLPYNSNKHPFFISSNNDRGSNSNIDSSSNSNIHRHPNSNIDRRMSVDSYKSLSHPHSKFDVGSVCGPVKKEEYSKQYYNYTNCRLCKDVGKCWSSSQQKCVTCNQSQFNKTCEKIYGCKRDISVPDDIAQYVPPKNPLYTNCVACWK